MHRFERVNLVLTRDLNEWLDATNGLTSRRRLVGVLGAPSNEAGSCGRRWRPYGTVLSI